VVSDRWRRGPRAARRRPRRAGTFAAGPGYPWPVVLAVAVVVTSVLAWLLSHRAGLLGLMFPVGYAGVCVLGVAMVRSETVVVPALGAAGGGRARAGDRGDRGGGHRK
jgi:hypothetical protein